MKIVHVINSLATGGAENFVVNLALFGIEMGHDVSVVLLQESKGIPQEIANSEEIPFHVLGTSLKDPRLVFRLRRACVEADVVHVHIFPAFYWAAAISKPKVYTEHSSNNRRRDMKIFSLLERWAYSRYDRVITISDGVGDALRKHLKAISASPEISSVPNGVNKNFFQIDRTYSPNPMNVAIVGSLRPVKQHSVAIKAIALLEGITLNIAGDGPLRDELEALTHELGVEDRVHFLGNVKDVPSFLSRQDLLLSTSAWEGMSTVVVEAQATGIPVVGADVPGIRDVLVHEKTGLLFSGTNASDVADAVKQALSPDLYLRLCHQTREYASRYSIDNCFKTHLEIYNEILGDKS